MSRFFAVTPKGVEPFAAEELKKLGAINIELGFGGVYFEGGNEALYKAVLWARTPSRILSPMRAEFAAKTSIMLYDQIRRMKWQDYLTPETTFAVSCVMSGKKAEEEDTERYRGRSLEHSRFVALKIKDAIVDALRERLGSRPNVDIVNPDLRIHAFLNAGRCTLSLEASGYSMHERGYRSRDSGAPMKENLAAAVLLASAWDPQGDIPLYDPMCGSGTLAIEAALMATDTAPGLLRMQREGRGFALQNWPDYDAKLWESLVDDAKKRADRGRKRTLKIWASDKDLNAVRISAENARRAGVLEKIEFHTMPWSTTSARGETKGVLVMNPPYGERLGEVERLKSLYKDLGDGFKQRFKGWTAFVFTGNKELMKSVGLKASRRIPFFNGPLECRLLRYDLY